MNEAVIHRALHFDRFSLDLMRGCLRAGEQEIDLRPKAFEVLRYLVNNAGRLVAKREIHDAVWPNVAVSDESIKQCIRELRGKLGEGGHSLIKTIPRRGYLFDAAVSVDAPHHGEQPAAMPPRAQLTGTLRPLRVDEWIAPGIMVLGAGWWVSPVLSRKLARLVTQPKLEQPHAVDQFDGVWRVEWSNNEHCFERSAAGIWIVRQGAVISGGNGKTIGTVSSAGELRYTNPARIDPNLTNVGLATLQGGRGQGQWDGQRGCAGVFTLVRTSPAA